jgi:hypothetical protein
MRSEGGSWSPFSISAKWICFALSFPNGTQFGSDVGFLNPWLLVLLVPAPRGSEFEMERAIGGMGGMA